MNDIRLKLIEKIKDLKDNNIVAKDLKQSGNEDSRIDDILHDIENLFSHNLYNGDIRINGKLICKHFFTTHSLLITEGSGQTSRASSNIQSKTNQQNNQTVVRKDNFILTGNDIIGNFDKDTLGIHQSSNLPGTKGKLIDKYFQSNLNIAYFADPTGEKIDDSYFNFDIKLSDINDMNRFFESDTITNFIVDSEDINGFIKLINIDGKTPNVSWNNFSQFNHRDIFVNKINDSQYLDNLQNVPKIKDIFNTHDIIKDAYLPIVNNDKLLEKLINKYNFKNIYETSDELPSLLFNNLKQSNQIQSNVKSLLYGDPSGNYNNNKFILSNNWGELLEGYISDNRIKHIKNQDYPDLDSFRLKKFNYKECLNDKNTYIGLIANDISDKTFIENDEITIKCNIKCKIYYDSTINKTILKPEKNIVSENIIFFYIWFGKNKSVINVNKYIENYGYDIEFNLNSLEQPIKYTILSYKIRNIQKIKFDRLMMYFIHKLNKKCKEYDIHKNKQLEKIDYLNIQKKVLEEKFIVLNKRIMKLENKVLDINNG